MCQVDPYHCVRACVSFLNSLPLSFESFATFQRHCTKLYIMRKQSASSCYLKEEIPNVIEARN